MKCSFFSKLAGNDRGLCYMLVFFQQLCEIIVITMVSVYYAFVILFEWIEFVLLKFYFF